MKSKERKNSRAASAVSKVGLGLFAIAAVTCIRPLPAYAACGCPPGMMPGGGGGGNGGNNAGANMNHGPVQAPPSFNPGAGGGGGGAAGGGFVFTPPGGGMTGGPLTPGINPGVLPTDSTQIYNPYGNYGTDFTNPGGGWSMNSGTEMNIGADGWGDIQVIDNTYNPDFKGGHNGADFGTNMDRFGVGGNGVNSTGAGYDLLTGKSYGPPPPPPSNNNYNNNNSYNGGGGGGGKFDQFAQGAGVTVNFGPGAGIAPDQTPNSNTGPWEHIVNTTSGAYGSGKQPSTATGDGTHPNASLKNYDPNPDAHNFGETMVTTGAADAATVLPQIVGEGIKGTLKGGVEAAGAGASGTVLTTMYGTAAALPGAGKSALNTKLDGAMAEANFGKDGGNDADLNKLDLHQATKSALNNNDPSRLNAINAQKGPGTPAPGPSGGNFSTADGGGVRFTQTDDGLVKGTATTGPGKGQTVYIGSPNPDGSVTNGTYYPNGIKGDGVNANIIPNKTGGVTIHPEGGVKPVILNFNK